MQYCCVLDKIQTKKHLFLQLGLVTSLVAVLIGGFAITPSYGQASPFTQTFMVPFQRSGGEPLCGGEIVTISGNLLFLTHSTTGPDSSKQYTVEHWTYQGVQGTTTSGTKIVITEADTSNIRQISPDQTEVMFQAHGSAIIEGKSINTVVTIVFIITFNANGQPTATVEHFDVKCVG